MSEQWLAILGTLLKSMQGGGTSNDAVRQLIQEELKRSQNKENSEALQHMLSMVERRHAERLDEKNREIDKYKMQVEFLSKQVQELNKEKKSVDRTDKMKDLLTHLAELNIQNQQRPTHNRYQKQNSSTSQPHSQDHNRGGPLPWMDHPKGKAQFHQHGSNQQNKFLKSNFHTNSSPNQKYPSKPDFQNKQPFQHDQNFQKNYHTSSSNQNFQHDHKFQQQQYVQQPQRGQPSNRFRGWGQRGAADGGRVRSASVGRDKKQFQGEMNNAAYDQPSTSFHIRVTKVEGQQWVSTENISCQSDNSHRGRGNSRGRGRGRGRGHGNSQQGIPGGQHSVKKNRRKYPQSEYQGHPNQDVPKNKEKNNDGDPEDNCILS